MSAYREVLLSVDNHAADLEGRSQRRVGSCYYRPVLGAEQAQALGGVKSKTRGGSGSARAARIVF